MLMRKDKFDCERWQMIVVDDPCRPNPTSSKCSKLSKQERIDEGEGKLSLLAISSKPVSRARLLRGREPHYINQNVGDAETHICSAP